MRTIARAGLLLAALMLLSGCQSLFSGERAVRDAERDRMFGSSRRVSWDPINPERDMGPNNPFPLGVSD